MTNITPQNTENIREKNLKPWQPGQSGNPAGRPKKEFSLTDGMRDFLTEKDPIKKQERKELLIDKTYQQAMRGDISAIKLLWNYLEGMPQGSGTNIQLNILNLQPSEISTEQFQQLCDKVEQVAMEKLGKKIKVVVE